MILCNACFGVVRAGTTHVKIMKYLKHCQRQNSINHRLFWLLWQISSSFNSQFLPPVPGCCSPNQQRIVFGWVGGSVPGSTIFSCFLFGQTWRHCGAHIVGVALACRAGAHVVLDKIKLTIRPETMNRGIIMTYYMEARGWIFSFSWTMMVPVVIVNAEETINALVTLVETKNGKNMSWMLATPYCPLW